MTNPTEVQIEPSLSVVCHACGNNYSLHMATVCPECFAWPIGRLQFTGDNCISVLRWSGCPHWYNLELQNTDKPYVYVDGKPVLMEKGYWAVKDSQGNVTVERSHD